jgi:hypothetical protein
MTSAWIFLCTDKVEWVDVCGIALGTDKPGGELFGASIDDIEDWRSASVHEKGNPLTLCTRHTFGLFTENRYTVNPAQT